MAASAAPGKPKAGQTPFRFTGAGLHDDGRFGFTPVRRLTPEAAELFDAAAAAFVERLTRIVPPQRVILHRALWMSSLRRGDAVAPFPEARAAFGARHNEALGRDYDALASRLGGPVFGPEPERHHADADHKWALEPFHYEPAYNDAAIAELQRLFGVSKPT